MLLFMKCSGETAVNCSNIQIILIIKFTITVNRQYFKY